MAINVLLVTIYHVDFLFIDNMYKTKITRLMTDHIENIIFKMRATNLFIAEE